MSINNYTLKTSLPCLSAGSVGRRRGSRMARILSVCDASSHGLTPLARNPRIHRSTLSQNLKRSGVACQGTSNGNGNGNGNGADVENVVIIGSGPAGYTAAIYAARANLKPVVIEGVQAGGVRGGQLMTTTEVENFPGFPDGITGPNLMDRMRSQAARWGAELHTDDVVSVDTSSRPYKVSTSDATFKTNSIIIATGATAKRLGIPSEAEFWSRGISACAICDGASPLFKNQEVAVVGGGDSATEEAHYITKYAHHVHLLVRGPRMRASKTMQDRVLNNPKITVHYNTGIVDAYGDSAGMKGVLLEDTATGEQRKLPLRGLFYGIGHKPNSELVKGQVELDEAGYVRVFEGVATSREGVFAAGDIQDTEWRQAITAAGSGCMAAIQAERYLTANSLIREFHTAPAVATESEESEEEVSTVPSVEPEFDVNKVRHKGQYALRKLYHESDRLLVVLYTSPTCGPCRTLKPMVSTVVSEFGNGIHYVEIDIEQDPEIAEAAGVMGTPTLQCFKAKERVENVSGVKMKTEMRKMFGKYISAASAEQLQEAEAEAEAEAPVAAR